MSECKIMIVNWLKAKKRTDEEIADKIVEAIDLTYKETFKHVHFEMGKNLFKELLKRPEIPKIQWHGLW